MRLAWARQDLNLQPTDYESASPMPLTRQSVRIRRRCCKVVARQTRVRGKVEAATQGLARRVDQIIMAVGRTRRVADGITEDPHVRADMRGFWMWSLSLGIRMFCASDWVPYEQSAWLVLLSDGA